MSKKLKEKIEKALGSKPTPGKLAEVLADNFQVTKFERIRNQVETRKEIIENLQS